MRMQKRGTKGLLVSAVFLLGVGLVASGCGGGGGGTPQDVQESLNQGNTSLDAAADSFQAAGGQPEAGFGTSYTASQADLTAARDSYAEALEGDPNNQQANLGMAFVEVMMLLGDTNATYGIEQMTTQPPGPGLMGRGWQPGKFLSRLANRQGQPTVTDLQNHIESVVIPRLEEIIAQLENVTDENLEVQIPPEPDPENPDDYVNLDYGDVLLLRAIVYQVLDLAHSAVVYDLDPGTFYDGEPTPPDLDADPDDGVLTPAEFLPPDPFLALRANGGSHSQAALAAERQAMSNLVGSVEFMLAEYEAGTQDHEVIPVGTGPEEADPADLAQVHSLATLLAAILTDAYWLNPSEEIDPTTPDINILIDLPAFANDPPEDLKDLVPDLTYAQDPITGEYYVSGAGALPDLTFAGLFPEGLSLSALVAMGSAVRH